jgi:hypothetical protein
MKVPGYADYGMGAFEASDLLWLVNPLGSAVAAGLTDDQGKFEMPKIPGLSDILGASSGGTGGQVSSTDQIRKDAANLRRLGYQAPDTGDAYNSGFRSAVRAFQASVGLEADGLIGPNTRNAIAAKLGTVGPSLPSLPPASLPTIPAGGVPADGMSLTTMALIGAGVIGLGGAVLYAMQPKRRSNPSRPRRRRGARRR